MSVDIEIPGQTPSKSIYAQAIPISPGPKFRGKNIYEICTRRIG